MPAMWMDVDAALAAVPINVVPLIDDTDFKTREESVTYNQVGLDLLWNFVTSAGAYTQTAVTPTDTGGDYDWVNKGNGMYSIEIPVSGGISINNDTEGYGWFSGYATGILPWSGPIIGFRAAGLNDLLCDSAHSATRGLVGTALPAVAADGVGGLPISDDGGLDMDSILEKMLAYFQLLTRSDAAIETDNATELTAINADGGSGGGNFSSQTDAVEALQDRDFNATQKASINTEADTALSDINLDHLMKVVVADRDVMAEVVDGTVLANLMTKTDGDTSDFDPDTDSLEALRDRGDAAWAGAPEACSGTLTVQTADTVFNLTATLGTLSSQDDTYNNMIICILDDSGSVYETARITDYDGTNTRITIDHELTFPVDDGVDTWVIYRNAYAPVGDATVSDANMNTIADKVWDELDADHMTIGTKGLKMHHSGGGRY